jgi:hypothetical protein
MQLMPSTADRFGVTNSYDPVANIYAGTRYLRWLLQTFEGNADLAVAAYNAGEGNVWKYNGVPPFRETVNYINRIAKHVRALEPASGSPVASRTSPATRPPGARSTRPASTGGRSRGRCVGASAWPARPWPSSTAASRAS